MADEEALQAAIEAAAAAVSHQGDEVRSLKAELKDGKIEKAAVEAAIQKLAELKLELDKAQKAFEKATGKLSGANKEAFRAALANALERRMFYIPSFKIYGSVAGFYDYGPPGCAIKANITAAWRQHFILEENMLEVECPAVTPEIVLKASGHVDRFTDFMVTDSKTGECYRADHLLEATIEALLEDKKAPPTAEAAAEMRDVLTHVGELKVQELGAAMRKYGCVAPDTKNAVSEPFAFNLMFKTSIGPRGDMTGYLRPETAQGIFVNFRDLLYFNGGKLPFAAAQIGNSYRNEISPRAGLLRVREFTQAEIEHFVNPADKSHPKFQTIAECAPLLYSRALQMSAEKKPKNIKLGDAVSQGIIANETLAYFIGRTWLLFQKIGIDPRRMRFRQHLQHEMAHYAEDCWDAEVETTYGWVECAGLADRSAYDLNAHAAMSKVELTAHHKYDAPRQEEVVVVKPVKKEIGLAFKKDQKAVVEALEGLSDEAALAIKASFDKGEPASVCAGGQSFTLTPAMVTIAQETKTVSSKKFVPGVIEPSFGIGRIIYCMLEHCYYTRDGETGPDAKTVFRFTPLVAPTKATVFPLIQRDEMNAKAQAVSAALRAAGLSNIIDTTGTTIGKRYARTDEIGVPFAVTIDGTTLEDGTATIRERDSTAQVRVPAGEIPGVIRSLVDSVVSWAEVAAKYPAQKTADEE